MADPDLILRTTYGPTNITRCSPRDCLNYLNCFLYSWSLTCIQPSVFRCGLEIKFQTFTMNARPCIIPPFSFSLSLSLFLSFHPFPPTTLTSLLSTTPLFFLIISNWRQLWHLTSNCPQKYPAYTHSPSSVWVGLSLIRSFSQRVSPSIDRTEISQRFHLQPYEPKKQLAPLH